jgi:hypothetical protein
MSWVDENKAWARAWAEVPEPIEIVVKRDGTVYFEGQRSDLQVNYSNDIATLADGTPVIVREPLPGGEYRMHSVYNPASIEEYREQIFETALKDIKAHKWDGYYAKKVGLSVDEYLAQKAAGIKNPAPILNQDAVATMLTPAQCQERWVEDVIDTHYRVPAVWRRNQFRCICRDPECVHFRNGR